MGYSTIDDALAWVHVYAVLVLRVISGVLRPLRIYAWQEVDDMEVDESLCVGVPNLGNYGEVCAR